MARSTRRAFLKQGGLGVAGAAAALAGPSTRAVGANERIAIGLIGCGGQGRGLGCSNGLRPR